MPLLNTCPECGRRQIKCDKCGLVFHSPRSEAEVQAEQEANGWGDTPPDELMHVCHECYIKLTGRN